MDANDKFQINKTRSCVNNKLLKTKNDPTKPKSFVEHNNPLRSADVSPNRTKKSKLVGEPANNSPVRRGMNSMDLFMDNCNTSSCICQGMDNASLVSMNFSQYELMRNMSLANCESQSGCSAAQCSTTDTRIKNEQLERYFRSVDMWKNFSDQESTSVLLELPKNL